MELDMKDKKKRPEKVIILKLLDPKKVIIHYVSFSNLQDERATKLKARQPQEEFCIPAKMALSPVIAKTKGPEQCTTRAGITAFESLDDYPIKLLNFLSKTYQAQNPRQGGLLI